MTHASEGTRDRLVRCGQEAVTALGLDEHNDSPQDVRDAINRLLAENEAMKPKPAAKPTEQYCDHCDGCGWYEGGVAIQTHCERCNGTGVIKSSATN